MRGITITGRRFEGMRESELCALEQTRVQAGKVARLRQKCAVIVPRGGYRSPTLSGMPGGGGDPCGLDGSKRECEALLEVLAREEKTLARMRAQAEKIIARSDMKAEMKEFCRGYYLRRMSVEEAADCIGVSARTGWYYKSDIEAERRARKPRHKRKNAEEMVQKNLQ